MRHAETTAPRDLAGCAAQTETTTNTLRSELSRSKAARIVTAAAVVRCAACAHVIVGDGAHARGMIVHAACAVVAEIGGAR